MFGLEHSFENAIFLNNNEVPTWVKNRTASRAVDSRLSSNSRSSLRPTSQAARLFKGPRYGATYTANVNNRPSSRLLTSGHSLGPRAVTLTGTTDKRHEPAAGKKLKSL